MKNAIADVDNELGFVLDISFLKILHEPVNDHI
jgi:hypothetical protein